MKKEFIQIRRDRRILPILIIMPVLQLIILGYAVSSDIKHLATAVCDLDRTPESRALIDRFATSGYFDIRYTPSDDRQIKPLMDAGQGPGGDRDPAPLRRQAGRRGDGRGPAPARRHRLQHRHRGPGLRHADRERRVRPASWWSVWGPRQPPPLAVDTSIRVWFNPDLKSVNFMVPGVVALILTIVTMTMTATAIVKEKERGTIEQLIVSPIRPVQLMLGKAIPFVIIGYADILLVVLVGLLWFRVPVAGSFPLLLALSGLFIMTTLGLGLLISTVSQTQQQAMMLGFFANPPFMLLSGFIFPDRQHARANAVPYLPYPPALLSGHHPWDLPEGCRP